MTWQEERDWLRRAKVQRAVSLHLGGITHVKIGEIMGIGPQAVELLLAEARQRMPNWKYGRPRSLRWLIDNL
jgi:hypothetical protein